MNFQSTSQSTDGFLVSFQVKKQQASLLIVIVNNGKVTGHQEEHEFLKVH